MSLDNHRSKVIKASILGVFGLIGILSLYADLRGWLTDEQSILSLVAYVVVGYLLMRALGEGARLLRPNLSIPDSVSAVACFVVAMAIAFLAPSTFPNTRLAVTLWGVPLVGFIFAGGFFIARVLGLFARR